MTDQHTWLSGLTDRLTYPPFFLGWLTDKHTWLSTRTEICVLSVCCQLLTSAYISTDWLLPSYFASWVLPTYHHICLSILPTYQGRLTDQHPVTYVYIFGLTAFWSDWPSCLCSYPAYLSGLLICLPIWADSETFLPSFLHNTFPLSWYEWNTIERDNQIIHS